MTDENIVRSLNTFLKGRYMGIHAYEHFIEKLQEPDIKTQFQQIQQDHKRHAMRVAERIQNLGEVPADDEGFVGSVQGFMSKLKMPEDTKSILQSALKGEEHYAVEMSEEIVRGHLDSESYELIHAILEQDRKHVELLKGLID
ncbi:DUF2383 domain-containing protein [Paenibacillus sp. GM2]|uniref:DUF2383 domain-containing protein n=1 Tax=Paenibacillus sp. GM2 TaxID=1622070 RepID=UPI000839BD43|nr:DUF2383 domain-containing protein [Paenibacillus sp. GM2]